MDQSAPRLPAPGAAPLTVAPTAAPTASQAAPAAPGQPQFAPPAPSPAIAAPMTPAPQMVSPPQQAAPALPVPAPPVQAQPQVAQTPPSPPMAAPALPLAQPHVPAQPQLPGQPASPMATVSPVAAARPSAPRRGLLMAGLGVVTVGAVGAGAFVLTRDGGDDVIVDDAVEVISDRSVEDTAAYSFAAATASAQQAASITFDMDIETPDGPMTAVASFDRATELTAIDIDISQLVIEDDFIGMGDSFNIVLDESNGTVYMSASIMGALFGELGAEWISSDSGDVSADDDLFGQLFTNPLGIADVFGDVEPIDLGEETIDGETLRHYQVTTDEFDIDQGSMADEFTDTSTPAVDTTYDVWVSENNQIRRMTFIAIQEGEPGSVDIWIDISSDPIDIAVPDPSDVLDIDALFGEVFSETTDFDMEGGEGTSTVETDGDGGISVSVSVDLDPMEFSTDEPVTTEQMIETVEASEVD